jgi:hypothetical protein
MNDEWRTPPDVLERAFRIATHREPIPGKPLWDYDLCCTRENCVAPRGNWNHLKMPSEIWHAMGDAHRVWCNPPYSRGNIKYWWRIVQALRELDGEAKVVRMYVMLLPADTSTQWFAEIDAAHEVSYKFLQPRVRFLKPDGTPGGTPRFGSMVVLVRTQLLFY